MAKIGRHVSIARVRESGGSPGEINPYAAPAAPVEEVAAVPAAAGAFRSTTGLARALALTLSLFVVFRVVQIIHDVDAIGVMRRVMAQAPYQQSELTAIDHRSKLLTSTISMLYLVVVVMFCFFMARANRNSRAFGLAAMEFSPGWSAGVFFVPIWSLYKPYRAMREIWNGSNPDPQSPIIFVSQPGTALLKCWWGMFLVTNLLGQGVNQAFKGSKSPAEFISRSSAGLIEAGVSAVAAILAAAVVMAVAERQDKRQRSCPAGTRLG